MSNLLSIEHVFVQRLCGLSELEVEARFVLAVDSAFCRLRLQLFCLFQREQNLRKFEQTNLRASGGFSGRTRPGDYRSPTNSALISDEENLAIEAESRSLFTSLIGNRRSCSVSSALGSRANLLRDCSTARLWPATISAAFGA